MNILFINDFPFPGAGGVGRVTETLAAEFIAKGNSVVYLSLTHGNRFALNDVIQYFIPDSITGLHRKKLFLKSFIVDNKIDLIINQGGSKPQVLNLIKGLNKNGVILFSVHHNCVKCLFDNYQHIMVESYKDKRVVFLIKNKFTFAIINLIARIKHVYNFRRAINESDKFILLSERFVPELKEITFIRNSQKIIGIPNPAPFNVVYEVEKIKENRILFVGRIDIQQKRVDLLLRVWEKLCYEFPSWSFDIVGDGPNLDELKSNVASRKLPRIYFHGYHDPRPYLERAKLFCLTSAFEGYGMVLVEALAYGVVPFAFNTFSNLQDIIDHKKNGVIIKAYDVLNYVSELSNLMKNDEERKIIAGETQKAIGKYHPAIIARKWLDLYEDVSNRRK